jgi:hypothetical protein
MAMANIRSADVAAVSLDIVSAYIQQYLWQNSVLMNTVIDRSVEAVGGVKSIDIGRRSSVQAQTKTANTALESKRMTWSADNLALDKHEVVYTLLEDAADIESSIAQEPQILEASAQALLTLLEGNIYAAIAATSAAAPDHRIKFKTASVVSLADILSARKLLNVANCPFENRWMAVHPDQEETVLSLKNIIEVQKYPQTTTIVNGEIGRIYGFRVVVSNNVTADTALFYHSTHVAFARQLALKWEMSRNLAEVGTEYLLQQKYGVKTLDAGVRGVLMNNIGA